MRFTKHVGLGGNASDMCLVCADVQISAVTLTILRFFTESLQLNSGIVSFPMHYLSIILSFELYILSY